MDRSRSHRSFTASLIALVGLLSLSSVALADASVTIGPTGFSPTTLTVTPGEKVVWSNPLAQGTHTATADQGAFDTGPIGPGQSASVTFLKVGTYAYTCQIVPSMKGAIIVAQAAQPTPTPRTTRSPGTHRPPPTDLASDLRGGDGGSPTGLILGLLLASAATMVAAFRVAASRRRGPSKRWVVIPSANRSGPPATQRYPQVEQWTPDDPTRG